MLSRSFFFREIVLTEQVEVPPGSRRAVGHRIASVLRTFIRGMRGHLERGSKPPILQARGTQACRRVMSVLAATSLRRGCLNRPSGSYPDGFIRSEFRAIVLQASQGVGMLAGQDSEAAHLNSLKSALES